VTTLSHSFEEDEVYLVIDEPKRHNYVSPIDELKQLVTEKAMSIRVSARINIHTHQWIMPIHDILPDYSDIKYTHSLRTKDLYFSVNINFA
jgi:hypothetical protein